jgi:outer membrane protein OmpA-like peptidoglycan-associated protein
MHGIGQVAYTVEALDIRPAGSDFAPVLVDSSLVFASIRARAQAIAYTDPGTHKPLADLYRVRLHSGRPGHPRLMDGTLCSRFNDGPAAFSPSGDTICFTRNGNAKRGGADVLSLFFATRTGKDWSDPVPFAYNGSGFSTMGACFSADGQRLYFASDRPGGQGGMDLYVCRKGEAGWSAPLDLGRTVNSSSNEAYPTVQANGNLCFASDRPGGLGKLDLYACAFAYGEFDTPSALPAPVNSPGNDLGWATLADGMSGYFSSDRDGNDQIFHFSARPELFRDCREQERNSYCFHFEDAGTTQADTLPLRYVWDFGDGSTLAALSTDHCYAKPGTYTVKLDLMDTLSESVFFNQVTYDLTVLDVEQANIHALDSAGTGQAVVFDTSHTNLPGFAALEVHWDFGDSAASMGGSAEHAYAQAGAYTVKLDLIGGPDGEGGYLHHCSTRAMRVIDGISVEAASDNAIASAYHFQYKELPSDAFNLSETDDKDVSYTVELFSSAERVDLNDTRFLRIRLHYPVVERFVPAQRLYTYSIATGTTPQAVYRAFSDARSEGFAASIVKRLPEERPVDMEQIEKLPLDKLNNAMVRISTVRFRSGERSFDPSFNTVLDQLIGVLVKYPQLELVIEAHTDDVGTQDSNMALSQDRAEAVLEYLTAHGVPAERLRPIGFGEDRPIATNKTATGREQNRRVEFRLNVPGTANTAHP